jgi:hypothetical protein
MRPTGVPRRARALALLLLLLSLVATGSLSAPPHSHLAGAAAAALDDGGELQLLVGTAASPDALVVIALGLCFVLGSALRPPVVRRVSEPRRSRAPPSG